MSLNASQRGATAVSALQPAELIAAVDLGSNSFHLLIVRADAGGVEVIEHAKEVVRIGACVGSNGLIGESAMARGFACLERFARRLRAAAPARVRVVGTNALRVAADAPAFLARAETLLGCRVETIAGIEEARLIYHGVSHGLQAGRRRLVVDVGGGSTELMIGEAAESLRLESLPVGCVSLTQRFFPDGGIDQARLRQAETAARREFEPVAGAYRATGWAEVAGASGTVHAIAAVARAKGWSDGTISPLTLDRLAMELCVAGNQARLRLPALAAEQLPVLPGGTAILRAVFAALGVERMRAVGGALRDGIIYDLLERSADDDIRNRSCMRLIERCRADAVHAERVERTALALLKQVESPWALDAPEHADWLAFAARLHEVGRAVAHNGYHRHGAYIVNHADLAGFSCSDQQCVASLIRTHRRALPLDEFDRYPAAMRERLLCLAVLLRLAVLLHRPRTGFAADDLRVTAADRTLALRFPPGWLAVHPLVAADLDEESAVLRAAEWELTYGDAE